MLQIQQSYDVELPSVGESARSAAHSYYYVKDWQETIVTKLQTNQRGFLQLIVDIEWRNFKTPILLILIEKNKTDKDCANWIKSKSYDNLDGRIKERLSMQPFLLATASVRTMRRNVPREFVISKISLTFRVGISWSSRAF